MHCLCLVKNYHNTTSNSIIRQQILLSNCLRVVHNLLRLSLWVTCTVHHDCANYFCGHRFEVGAVIECDLRSTESSHMQNVYCLSVFPSSVAPKHMGHETRRSLSLQVQQAALWPAQVPTSTAPPSPTATVRLHNGAFLQQPSQGIRWWRGKVADTYHPRTHRYLLKLRDRGLWIPTAKMNKR